MRYYIIIGLALLAQITQAQDIILARKAVLAEIEKNNTTLKAIRQQSDADKVLNAVDKALPDPKVGFSYSWGNKEGMPGKKTFSAEQDLDWGTITGLRSKVAKSANEAVEWNYKIQRQAVLSEADRLLVLMTYHNAFCKELESRTERARQIKEIYEKKMKVGDANQLEVNKASLYLNSIMVDMERATAERAKTYESIQRMNGNIKLSYDQTEYEYVTLHPLNDYLVYAKTISPQIQLARANLETAARQQRLMKSEGMPELSVGYTGEHVGGNNYNGISVGVSIPLWANSRKKMSYAKSQRIAAHMSKMDIETQTLSSITIAHNNATRLFHTAEQFKSQLTANEDVALLTKALHIGQISLLEYLNEIAFYDDARTKVIEAERDCQLSIAELHNMFR